MQTEVVIISELEYFSNVHIIQGKFSHDIREVEEEMRKRQVYNTLFNDFYLGEQMIKKNTLGTVSYLNCSSLQYTSNRNLLRLPINSNQNQLLMFLWNETLLV